MSIYEYVCANVGSVGERKVGHHDSEHQPVSDWQHQTFTKGLPSSQPDGSRSVGMFRAIAINSGACTMDHRCAQHLTSKYVRDDLTDNV